MAKSGGISSNLSRVSRLAGIHEFVVSTRNILPIFSLQHC